MFDRTKDRVADVIWNVGVLNVACVVKVLRTLDAHTDRKLAKRYARPADAPPLKDAA